MIEAHLRNQELPKPPPGMLPINVAAAETSYLNALEWTKQVRLETISLEESLVCECHQYGSTLDQVALLNGKAVDVEWKTSNAVYLDHLLQVAAQVHVWNCTHKKGPHLSGAAIVRFSKETGAFAYHWFDQLEEPWQQFLRFRECYDADQRLKKWVG